MPLLKGKENIGHNIKVEEEHGKPKKQAVAIALHTAGVPKKSDDALLPVDADTKVAIAAHNAGLTRSQDGRRQSPEDQARTARMEAANAEAEQALRNNHCPQCGNQVYTNNALPGWVQCHGYPAASHRRPGHENDKPCGWQGFTRDARGKDAVDVEGLLSQWDKLGKRRGNLVSKIMRSSSMGRGLNVPPDIAKVVKEAEELKVQMDALAQQMPANLRRKHGVRDQDPDLIQPVPVRPVPKPSGERNQRGWFGDRKVKDTSALAPKAAQFKNGMRVHNSKGSVGEVVHVNGDRVVVAVAGRRQEWPLSKTFRAGGAEDAKAKDFTPKGHNCDACGSQLSEKNYTAPGSWSYKCPSCRFKYNHNGASVEEQLKAQGKKAKRREDDELLPVDDVETITKRATPPAKPRSYVPFHMTAAEQSKVYAPKDPAGFKKQFGKDGYAESYAAARQRAGQLKPVPVGPAPDPETQKEVERRAKDTDCPKCEGSGQVAARWTMKNGKQVAESWRPCPACGGLGAKDAELKPVPPTRVNPAPMAKLVPKSKQKPGAKDAMPLWDVPFTVRGKKFSWSVSATTPESAKAKAEEELSKKFVGQKFTQSGEPKILVGGKPLAKDDHEEEGWDPAHAMPKRPLRPDEDLQPVAV